MKRLRPYEGSLEPPDDRSTGFILGLLASDAHFGGDGVSAQITLRLHTRREATLQWLIRVLPGSRVNGPYYHGGRNYFQWSVRGVYLRDYMVPLIQRHRDLLDDYAAARFDRMCADYHLERRPLPDPAPE